jgi:hypothetical protein
MIYYAIFSVGLALADGGKIPVGLALWLPNAIASIVAAILVRKITSEQWQSVSEGVFNVVARIVGFFMRRVKKA